MFSPRRSFLCARLGTVDTTKKTKTMDAFADLTCGGALKFGAADAEAMALFRRRASGVGAGETCGNDGWGKRAACAAVGGANKKTPLAHTHLSHLIPQAPPPPQSRT